MFQRQHPFNLSQTSPLLKQQQQQSRIHPQNGSNQPTDNSTATKGIFSAISNNDTILWIILYIILIFSFILAITAFITQSNTLSNLPPNLFTYNTLSDGVSQLAIFNPVYAQCIGPVTSCGAAQTIPGTLLSLVPILLPTPSNNAAHMLRYVNSILELSYINHSISSSFSSLDDYDQYKSPIAYFGNNGIQLGGGFSPFWLQPNTITVVGTVPSPNPPILNDMWAPSSGDAFVDPISSAISYRDAVCHTLNASICGTLFRSSSADPGIFISVERIIIKTVPYGFILANLDAILLVGGNVLLISYTNLGNALLCVRNPLYELASQSLYLAETPVDQSCYKYSSRILHIIPQAQCLPLLSVPALADLVGLTALQTAIVTISAQDQITVQLYADPICSQYTSTDTFQLGCSQSRFLWYLITN